MRNDYRAVRRNAQRPQARLAGISFSNFWRACSARYEDYTPQYRQAVVPTSKYMPHQSTREMERRRDKR